MSEKEKAGHDRLRLRLTLEVEYVLYGETEESMRARLEGAVREAFGNGRITGEGPAEVEGWRIRIEREGP